MKAVIINELTEKDYKEIQKKLKSGKNVLEFLEKKYTSYEMSSEHIDYEKLYSFNENTYVVKTLIYNNDYDKIGYLFIQNTKENVEMIKREETNFCVKCGHYLSNEVPFGELSSKQLKNIKFKENVKACHKCLRIVEEIDGKETTIKQSVIFKLKTI